MLIEIGVFLCLSLILVSLFHQYQRDKDSEEKFLELENNIANVLGIMLEKMTEISNLKEFIPEFSINQNPLQPIFEAIARNMGSRLKEDTHPRDSAGQWAELGDAHNGEKEI